ncbi:MAG: hypothetical protein ACRC8A_06535 [Microcoleaceae cyanobacterium]
MWLSTRAIRGVGDPEWEGYLNFLGLPHLQQVRTIDSWANPYVEESGDYLLQSLDELSATLQCLPAPRSDREYYLLFADALQETVPRDHPRLSLLGYDLSDETWTSSLLNCGRWEGTLAPIAQRVNQYGLLTLADAEAAQALLPDAWGDDPHAVVTVWALLEVASLELQSAQTA